MSSEGDINLTDRRSRWQASHLSAETFDLLKADAEVFVHQALSTPCLNVIRQASGSWLIDVEGRRYLDFHGNSSHQIGYSHPRVVQAVKEQLDVLAFSPRRYANEPATELADRLVNVAPGNLSRVLFSPSGTGAIGIALKVARVATGRFKTLSLWESFHGASLDAISIGGEAHFRDGIGPLMPGAAHVAPYDPLRCNVCQPVCRGACAGEIIDRIEKEGDFSAVIVEPMRATTAVLPPWAYWKALREACDRTGTLLVFDEIPTCLGRTGHMFATELTGIVPDIMVLGKGLGGAVFPMAATIVSRDLQIPEGMSLGHYTHEKSPLGAVAALATLDVIVEEKLVERSKAVGAQFVERLRQLKDQHDSIVEVRGEGLLIGVEMREASLAEGVMYHCLSNGLSFKVSSGTVLTLTPPLNITDGELELAFDALKSAISHAEKLS